MSAPAGRVPWNELPRIGRLELYDWEMVIHQDGKVWRPEAARRPTLRLQAWFPLPTEGGNERFGAIREHLMGALSGMAAGTMSGSGACWEGAPWAALLLQQSFGLPQRPLKKGDKVDPVKLFALADAEWERARGVFTQAVGELLPQEGVVWAQPNHLDPHPQDELGQRLRAMGEAQELSGQIQALGSARAGKRPSL